MIASPDPVSFPTPFLSLHFVLGRGRHQSQGVQVHAIWLALGSWSIDPADTHPTGITINPTNASDIWIVDNGTDKVYQYIGAASRTSVSQTAAATFALNPYNTNPLGIADPPTADMLLTSAAEPLASNQPSVTAMIPSLTNRDAAFALLAREPLQSTGEPAVGLLDNLTLSADHLGTVAGAFGVPNPLNASPLLPASSSPAAHSDGSAMGLWRHSLTGEDSEASAVAADFVSAGMANESAAED